MQYTEHFNITVDGPADAGKSIITKLTAKGLRFVYIDMGAVYRSMALCSVRQGISPESEEAVTEIRGQVGATIRYVDGVQQAILNREDVSGLVRSEEIGRMASITSVYRPVRKKLVRLQKQLARGAGIIVDGRGIDTYVLPDTPAKIYLTAPVEVRVGRRFRELEEEGTAHGIRRTKKDIEEKDYRNVHRENPSLRQAEDAALLDSSCMTIEQVVDSIICIVGERGYEG